MPITDDELAQRLGVNATQAEQLRISRGATSDTLGGLPPAAVRRAIRRLDYPDLPLLRDRFRRAQEVGDDGQLATDALARALAVRDELRTLPRRGRRSQACRWRRPARRRADGPAAGLNIAALGVARSRQHRRPDPGPRHRSRARQHGCGRRPQAVASGTPRTAARTGSPVDDFMANLACTCIVIDPADTRTDLRRHR